MYDRKTYRFSNVSTKNIPDCLSVFASLDTMFEDRTDDIEAVKTVKTGPAVPEKKISNFYHNLINLKFTVLAFSDMVMTAVLSCGAGAVDITD